jgi:hypothetical protein
MTCSRGLYQISLEILESLYQHNLDVRSSLSPSAQVSTIVQIEQSLSDWRSGLPQRLTMLDHRELLQDEEFSLLRKLRAVLTLRYLNLQLLAYRPILQSQLQLRERSEVQTSANMFLMQICGSDESVCFTSAKEIIEIVGGIASSPGRRRVLGAWWFSLYYSKSQIPLLRTEED